MTNTASKIVLSTALLATTIAAGATLANNNPLSDKADRPDREAVKSAIESGNYAEFVTLTEGSKFSDTITADNFGRLQEMYSARENGDTDTAKEIAEELELPERKSGAKEKKGGRSGKGRSTEMKEIFESLTDEQQQTIKDLKESENKDQIIPTLEGFGIEIPAEVKEKQESHQAIKTAIETGDFETFSTLTADKKSAGNITAENFSQFQAMHEAKQSGDTETAKAIADELGLKGKGDKGEKRGQRGEMKTQIAE